jgi:hypothetical protein
MTTTDRRDQLRALSRALQEVHRALLEVSRARYEVAHGPVGGSGELLQLVLRDEAFAWLQPLSALIVEIDELSARHRASNLAEVEEVRARVEALISSRDLGSFGARYVALLGSEPHIAMSHFALRTALRALPGPPRPELQASGDDVLTVEIDAMVDSLTVGGASTWRMPLRPSTRPRRPSPSGIEVVAATGHPEVIRSAA